MSHLPDTNRLYMIIDFGCADGSFMEFLHRNCPNYDYIGIDNDPEMQKLTKEKGFRCFSSLEEAEKNACIFPEHTCIVLNSIIHELYSYFNETVWWDILHFHPKYIAIRDMMYNPIDRTRFYLPADDYDKIKNIFNEKYPKQFNEFYKFWHHQDYEMQIAHFLLKYMYTENWEREVKENYLSYDINNIRKGLVGYSIEFQTFYKLFQI